MTTLERIITTHVYEQGPLDTPCLVKPHIRKDQYGQLWVKGRQERTHRLMWSIHNGPIPQGMFVLHICDNRRCCEITHLKLGTLQDNHDDMISKGRQPRGVTHALSKLTEQQIRDIRADTRKHTEIAKDHNTTKGTISKIKLRTRWNHVQ